MLLVLVELLVPWAAAAVGALMRPAVAAAVAVVRFLMRPAVAAVAAVPIPPSPRFRQRSAPIVCLDRPYA